MRLQKKRFLVYHSCKHTCFTKVENLIQEQIQTKYFSRRGDLKQLAQDSTLVKTTEIQNGWGCKRPLDIILFNLPSQAGPPKASCSGPCPHGFWISKDGDNLPGQLIPVLGHPHSKERPSWCSLETSCVSACAHGLLSCHYQIKHRPAETKAPHRECQGNIQNCCRDQTWEFEVQILKIRTSARTKCSTAQRAFCVNMELTSISKGGKINLVSTEKTAPFFIWERERNLPARPTFPTKRNPKLKSFIFYHSSFVKSSYSQLCQLVCKGCLHTFTCCYIS